MGKGVFIEIGIVTGILLILLVNSVSVVSAANYYNNYSDVLLVCNNASSDSMAICDYFISKRVSKGFLGANVVNLTGIPTTEIVDCSVFTDIKNQVNTTLQAVGASNINYIVMTKGVPLRACSRSVDSKLAVAFGNNQGYFAKKEVFSNSKYGGYLVTRLDGPSVQDAKNLIDNSDRAASTGLILINKYSTGYSNDYGCTDAYNSLIANGKSAELNNTLFVTNRNNLIGYWSWGSNSGGNANSSAWNLSFNPGAIGETAVSTSARTLNVLWSNDQGQSLISDLIRMNITGVKGYVEEPRLWAVANPNILFDRYVFGYNLADSYYMASMERDWMDVIIGDPKTAITKSTTAPAISLETLYSGERINNGTIINLTVQGTGFFDVSSVWYTKNGENLTLSSPYDINTTNWTYGSYNVTVYSNDTGGNLGTTSYTFIVNLTNGTTPRYSRFNGNTTDFKILEERNNVSNVVLEKELAGKIEFLVRVNVSGYDLDNNVTIEHNKIGINTVNLPNLNVSANITLYNNPSANYPLKNQLAILRNGNTVCNATTTLSCTNFTALNATTVIFNVSYFNNSNYSIGYSGQVGISNCQELQNMKNDLTASYYLMNDIDCTDTKYWNWNSTLGTYMGFEPVGSLSVQFTGSFDGQNHTIKGLHIYRNDTDYVGLFGNILANISSIKVERSNVTGRDIVGGIIGRVYEMSESKNLGLFNLKYEGYVNGRDNTGGLVGYIFIDPNSIFVSSSFSDAEINGRDDVGGLVGYTRGYEGGMINFNNSYSNSNISGRNNVGGLIGIHSEEGHLNNVYARGNVNGVSSVGGLVGLWNVYNSFGNRGNLTNSYFSGTVNGSSSIGALIGLNNYGAVLNNLFWLNSSSTPAWCWSNDTGNFSTDCIAINNESYFYNVNNAPIVNWSFNVWDDVNRGFGHPVLLWQNVTSVDVSNCGDIVEPVSYKLVRNITGVNGTCFNVYSNNATLNFSSFSVTGNTTGYGVFVNNTNNEIIHVNINNVISFLYKIFMQLTSNNYNNFVSSVNNINVSLNGTGNSTLYITMNNASKIYYVKYDGVLCYGNSNPNCSVNSNSNGIVNVTVKID